MFAVVDASCSQTSLRSSCGRLQWGSSVLVAVVYDDRLTDCLFELLLKTVARGNQTVYIALEKRVNFTLEDLDVASPSHTHFMQWLQKLRELGWKVCVVDLSDVPQYFGSYSRDSYLELWELTIKR